MTDNRYTQLSSRYLASGANPWDLSFFASYLRADGTISDWAPKNPDRPEDRLRAFLSAMGDASPEEIREFAGLCNNGHLSGRPGRGAPMYPGDQGQ